MLVLRTLLVAALLLAPLAALAADGPEQPPAKKPAPSQPAKRVEHTIEGWKVRVDDRLLADPHQELGERSLRFLASKLWEIKAVVRGERIADLQKVVIVVDLECGGLNAMQYHPSAGWLVSNGYTPDLEKCVHIPKAEQLATRRNINEQPWVILHELAHAYHDQFLDFEEQRIREAFASYQKSGRGEKVLLYDGRRVKHYALTNHKEFFAEMTEAFFGVNDFYPFTRAELKDSEPDLHELLTEIWLKKK